MIDQILIKTFRLSGPRQINKSTITTKSGKGFFQWRWISILLLGLLSNTLVNVLFDLKFNRQLISFNIEEYYNALIVSLILMEGTRWLSQVLNQRSLKDTSKLKMQLRELGLNLVFILVLLNLLVIGITYVFYASFYSFADLMIINAGVVPLALLFSSVFKEKSASSKTTTWNFFRWNWVSVVLLGISSNTLINAIFDYKYQRSLLSLSLQEYFNAIIAASILLGGTRKITKILDSKIPWHTGVTKRLLLQLSIHLIFIILALNGLLISITYIFYGGFYATDELMVINISVVSLTFFFSIIDASIYFFKHSKGTSAKSANLPKKPIQVSLGKVHHLIRQENIRCAISHSRLVFLMTDDERKLPYSESLDALMKTLDPHKFFRANRQTVLTHSVVKSIKPLEHGKIEVHLAQMNGQPESIVVSRTRAAEFRKWLKTQAA